MNLETLKSNRNEIIAFITLMEYDLKFAMEMAVEVCDNCDSIEELKEELRNYCRPVKGSKIAAMMAKDHEGEEYNVETKNWDKK